MHWIDYLIVLASIAVALIGIIVPGSYPWGKNPFLFSCSFQK